jgi:hypothetical protein
VQTISGRDRLTNPALVNCSTIMILDKADMISKLKNAIIIFFCVAYLLIPLSDAIACDSSLGSCTAGKEGVGQIEYQSLALTGEVPICGNTGSQNTKASTGTEDHGFCFVCSCMVCDIKITALSIIPKEASFHLTMPPLVLSEPSLFIFHPPKFL